MTRVRNRKKSKSTIVTEDTKAKLIKLGNDGEGFVGWFAHPPKTTLDINGIMDAVTEELGMALALSGGFTNAEVAEEIEEESEKMAESTGALLYAGSTKDPHVLAAVRAARANRKKVFAVVTDDDSNVLYYRLRKPISM